MENLRGIGIDIKLLYSPKKAYHEDDAIMDTFMYKKRFFKAKADEIYGVYQTEVFNQINKHGHRVQDIANILQTHPE